MGKIYQKSISFSKSAVMGKFGGFTLIELLVVVLIIGILAAIVWPQYEKAVVKSRYVQVHVSTNALYNALERYYMTNGVYPEDLNPLDIEFPGGEQTSASRISFENYGCSYYINEASATNSIQCDFSTPFFVGMRIFLSANKKIRRYCVTWNSTEKGKAFCSSMGGVNPFDSGSGQLHYLLP